MKNLFLTISWLELVRNKTRNWLLFIIVVAFSFSLSTCGHPDNFVFSQHESTSITQPLQDQQVPADSDNGFKLEEFFPPFAITMITMFLGFLVLMTVPFRGRQEWEDGQFQMIAMGDHSFYKVELTRFLSYLCLAALFFVTILICSGIFSWRHNLFPVATILKLQGMFMYRFMALVPLMLAFGVLVSAINTAYCRDGNSKLLTLVKYVSCFSFFVLMFKTANWFENPAHLLLPALHIPVEVPGGFSTTLALNFDYPILALSAAALFIFWAGRILEEVEA